MDHSSPIISCVANISIINPLPMCNANYCQMFNECNKKYDMSASDIDHALQSKLLNTTMDNVNVLSEMIDIRNGFKGCQILNNDDVNSIFTDITVFLNFIPLLF